MRFRFFFPHSVRYASCTVDARFGVVSYSDPVSAQSCVEGHTLYMYGSGMTFLDMSSEYLIRVMYFIQRQGLGP